MGIAARTAFAGATPVRTAFVARLAFAWPALARRVVEPPRQRDAFARDVDLQHLHLDDVAGLDHLARILDVAVGQRGDVDQAVLVHADVDEGAEGGDVAHHSLEHHARAQVLDVLHAVGEARGLELGARVAAGLLQLLQDVAHRRLAEALVGELARLERAHERGVAGQRPDRLAGGGDDALDHRVGLGVPRRSIQRLVAVGDAQEAGALLEGLPAKPRHFPQVAAAPDRALGVAVPAAFAGPRRPPPAHTPPH